MILAICLGIFIKIKYNFEFEEYLMNYLIIPKKYILSFVYSVK